MSETDAEQFSRLALSMYGQRDVEHTLDQVLSFAVTAVGCDHAGVMLVHARGEIETAAATTDLVEKADQLQLEYDEGPCVSAIEEERNFVILDTTSDPRWPRWGPRVAELGMRSVLSAELATDEAKVGALNLYATQPDFFDAEDQAVAKILARHAALALAITRRHELLNQAVDTQTKLGQALGILMARNGLDQDQGFAVLRQYSQDNNVKLRVVVERLIASAGPPEG